MAGSAQGRRVATDDPPAFITLRSDWDIDQLLRRVVTRSEGRGLDVYAVIDVSGDAADAGFTMPETKLVLFASPAPVIELVVDQPGIAIELPLKLLIFESPEGHALISYLAPDSLAHRYELDEDETDILRVVETLARDAQHDS